MARILKITINAKHSHKYVKVADINNSFSKLEFKNG
jgi:hypothetical protein